MSDPAIFRDSGDGSADDAVLFLWVTFPEAEEGLSVALKLELSV